MRSLLITLCLILTAHSVCAAAPVDSVWPLQSNGQNICTATSINSAKHYWLLAAHCVAQDPLPLPDGQQGPSAPDHLTILGEEITVVMRDVINDIAILSTPRVTAPELPLATFGGEMGDPVTVIGFPLGLTFPVMTKGILSAPSGQIDKTDSHLYALFNVTGAPGNSGSAILNEKGEIISILQAGWGRSFSSMVGGVPFSLLAPYRSYFPS